MIRTHEAAENDHFIEGDRYDRLLLWVEQAEKTNPLLPKYIWKISAIMYKSIDKKEQENFQPWKTMNRSIGDKDTDNNRETLDNQNTDRWHVGWDEPRGFIKI